MNIPKENGTTRPIGISTVEDKVVQGALRDVLQAIYEQDFLDCSYGFRPGRSAHDAISTLDGLIMRGNANYIVEADIVSFFDSISRKLLMEMLRSRIADESLMRLIGKCLHVGVLEGQSYLEPDEGTAQGASLSPLLGNVYLHHVLDVWFEREVRPQPRGRSALVRYADDFVLCFECAEDAQHVWNILEERFKKCILLSTRRRPAASLSSRRATATERGARPSTSWVSRCTGSADGNQECGGWHARLEARAFGGRSRPPEMVEPKESASADELEAVDLGGVHGAQSATVDFDAEAASLGITVGNVYPLDVFHAERHTTESNFRIETSIDCLVIVD